MADRQRRVLRTTLENIQEGTPLSGVELSSPNDIYINITTGEEFIKRETDWERTGKVYVPIELEWLLRMPIKGKAFIV